MTEKLARRGLKVHLEYEVDVLHQVKVREVMDRTPATVPPDITLGEIAARIGRHDPTVARHDAYLMLDAAGRFAGIVTRGDVFRALENRLNPTMALIEVGSRRLVVAYPDESLHDAAEKMLEHGIGRLPVVEAADPGNLVGYLDRGSIFEARQHRLTEESVVETGWLGHSRRGNSPR